MRAYSGDRGRLLFMKIREVSLRPKSWGHFRHGEQPSVLKDPVVGIGRTPGTERKQV